MATRWEGTIHRQGGNTRLHFESPGAEFNAEMSQNAAMRLAASIYAAYGKSSPSKTATAQTGAKRQPKRVQQSG